MAVKEWITNNNFVICNHEIMAECSSADVAEHLAACHNEDQRDGYSTYKNKSIKTSGMFWSAALGRKVTIPEN